MKVYYGFVNDLRFFLFLLGYGAGICSTCGPQATTQTTQGDVPKLARDVVNRLFKPRVGNTFPYYRNRVVTKSLAAGTLVPEASTLPDLIIVPNDYGNPDIYTATTTRVGLRQKPQKVTFRPLIVTFAPSRVASTLPLTTTTTPSVVTRPTKGTCLIAPAALRANIWYVRTVKAR